MAAERQAPEHPADAASPLNKQQSSNGSQPVPAQPSTSNRDVAMQLPPPASDGMPPPSVRATSSKQEGGLLAGTTLPNRSSSSSSSSTTARQDPRREGPRSSFLQRRRSEALQRQQAARNDLADQARRLALQQATLPECPDPRPKRQDVDMGEGTSGRQPNFMVDRGVGKGHRTAREVYAAQLLQPEWLIDVPPDLGSEWYVLPRPEGRRCLVVSSGGWTSSWMRNGIVLHKFPSALPNGSRQTQGPSEIFCILDCIFHEPDATYYVLDIMCWKGYSLYDCAAEFRMFWLHTKLAETAAGSAPSQAHRHAFTPVPAHECTPEGLRAAHSGRVPFVRDGVVLLHREGHYEPGTSPLALLWKDAACSRYLLDTDAQGVVPPHQTVVLQLQQDSSLVTADEPPVTLGRLTDELQQSLRSPCSQGKLLRFYIGKGGMQIVDGRVAAADLLFDSASNQRRGRPDLFSKIVFQYMARRQPITLEQLIDASSSSQEDTEMVADSSVDLSKMLL